MNDVRSDVKVVFLDLECAACFAISRMQAHPEFSAEKAASVSTIVALGVVQTLTLDVAVSRLCAHHRAEYDDNVVGKTSGS